MKKLFILFALFTSAIFGQTQLSLSEINNIWKPGKVPAGTNQTNTWYSLANYGRYNYSVAITGAGTCTVSGTATSYTVTGAAQTSIVAGTGITVNGSVPSYTISASGTTPSITGVGSITVTGTAPTFSVSTTIDDAWTNVPFNAGDFTASPGTWTVEEVDVSLNRYKIIGKTMFWNIFLDQTSIAGSPTQLFIDTPAGIAYVYASKQFGYYNNAVADFMTICDTSIPLIFQRSDGTAFTNGTNNQAISIMLVLEIN